MMQDLVCVSYVMSVTSTLTKGLTTPTSVSASPGVRKYNYGISHDPAGRDFSIHYNPLDTDVDMDNYLPEPWRPPSHYTPQYRQYSPQYDRVLLSVQAPSPAAMQKSSRGIQGVHTAYSNSLPVQPTASDVIIRSPKPMTFADFDLGLMGYGDFMESQDYDSGASPSPTPAVHSTASPIVHSSPRAPPIRFLPKVKFPQNTLKFPKSNNQIGLVQNLRVPKLQYGFKPIDGAPVVPRQPSFTPSFDDDSRLQDLADKAFSKVFMSHNHARNPMVFSQTDHARFTDLGMLRQSQTAVSGRTLEKTVLVPVIYIPGQDRVPAHGILMSPYNSFNTKRD